MTTPPSAKRSDESPQAAAPVDKRSRNMYVLWAIALTLLLTAALFCWLVVVPVWRVQRVITEVGRQKLSRAEAVQRLGGPDASAGPLISYLRLPESLRRRLAGLVDDSPGSRSLSCPDAWIARLLLVECKGPAVDFFMSELGDEDPTVRRAGVEALGMIGPGASDAIPALEALAKDPHASVRQAAAKALKKIKAAQEKPKP
jgi:HEAT repeat protein